MYTAFKLITVLKHVKGKKCRFNAPWPPTKQTKIVFANEDKKSLDKANKCINKILKEVQIIGDAIANFDLDQLLDSAHVSRKDYDSCLDIIYKRCTMLDIWCNCLPNLLLNQAREIYV